MAATEPTLSVCMIVKDEEGNLPRLLRSIEGLADEVIVVDTGSEDKTVEIAKSFGASVHSFKWCDDFAAARNESLAHATKDYILWLDGDDEIENTEHRKIREHLKGSPDTAVYLKLRNIQDSEETEAIQLRIFPNHRGIHFEGRVHEQVYNCIAEKKIPFSSCEAVVRHHGYHDAQETTEKLYRNIGIHEKEIRENPDNCQAYFFLARALKGLGELEKALEQYLVFIEKGERERVFADLDLYKIGLLDAAEILWNLSKTTEALDLLIASRKRFPAFKLFNYLLGQFHFQMKEYEDAHRELLPLRGFHFENQCLPMDVKKSQLLFLRYLGVSSLFTGDYETAVESLEGLVRLQPGEPENYHYLALTYEKAGDMGKSVDACDRGLRGVANDSSLVKRRFLLVAKAGEVEQTPAELKKLNGHANDIDVMAAIFLTYCRALDMAGIGRSYRMIEERLHLSVLDFPEGIDAVQRVLKEIAEPKADELFNMGISHLLRLDT
jgi:glycosyltransferase involved in cell wall biosynthesis